jgi:hypothetical protein
MLVAMMWKSRAGVGSELVVGGSFISLKMVLESAAQGKLGGTAASHLSIVPEFCD